MAGAGSGKSGVDVAVAKRCSAAKGGRSDCCAIGSHSNHARLAQLNGNTVAMEIGQRVADAARLFGGGARSFDNSLVRGEGTNGVRLVAGTVSMIDAASTRVTVASDLGRSARANTAAPTPATTRHASASRRWRRKRGVGQKKPNSG